MEGFLHFSHAYSEQLGFNFMLKGTSERRALRYEVSCRCFLPLSQYLSSSQWKGLSILNRIQYERFLYYISAHHWSFTYCFPALSKILRLAYILQVVIVLEKLLHTNVGINQSIWEIYQYNDWMTIHKTLWNTPYFPDGHTYIACICT